MTITHVLLLCECRPSSCDLYNCCTVFIDCSMTLVVTAILIRLLKTFFTRCLYITTRVHSRPRKRLRRNLSMLFVASWELSWQMR